MTVSNFMSKAFSHQDLLCAPLSSPRHDQTKIARVKLTLAARGYMFSLTNFVQNIRIIGIDLMKRRHRRVSIIWNWRISEKLYFSYKQYKKIASISVKRLQSAMPKRSIFFASRSVNLSLFIESLKTFWVWSNIAFFAKI